MSKNSKTETDEAAPKGKKKLFLVVGVVVLALAGAAYFFLFAGGEAEAAAPEHGGYVALEPVAVNLAGGGYLKVGITLDITVAAAAGGGHGGGATVDGAKAYDAIISTFSQANPADVIGARDALKEALEQKIIAAYTDHDVPMVMGIYYTEYVTQ
ncbi:flagellar FliL protein [Blastococcus aggregatus]|uniref:Flagellar protein FliL n=1 Tax=Blastococcus aggregatus TaxID=38502 RepID=A0A285UYU9_9ACTN|nr:flagellar basal body-associated FliL family protein [Blastococcus aggregatus]SOC47064.1 flagellar FliL protein [Blastococcus aggregatus]